ncbi:MAG: alpha/beta hydrolase [Chthoniobacterales bacterium]
MNQEIVDWTSIADIPYAKYGNTEVLLDLHLPKEPKGQVPIILSIPGGGWMHCNKSNWPTWYIRHGFAIASISYRLSGNFIAPANIHDCKAAVRWARANAERYGYDAQRVGVIGDSAGGHLTMLLGVTAGVKELEGDGGNPDFSSDVQAIAPICGVSDLTRMAIPEWKQNFEGLYQVTEAYLGGRVEDHLDLARLLSPLFYVSKNSPPAAIFHGNQDDVVPIQESYDFHEAYKKAGAESSMDTLEGVNHGVVKPSLDGVTLPFFKRHLKS